MHVVALTLDEALSLGIVVCANCGFPPNNHFDFDNRKCAHKPGTHYEQTFRMGTEIPVRPPTPTGDWTVIS